MSNPGFRPGPALGSGRAGFPSTVHSVSTMIDRGRQRISMSADAAKLGYFSAVGSDMMGMTRERQVTGYPGYVTGQQQTLIGTDIRNFRTSYNSAKEKAIVRS